MSLKAIKGSGPTMTILKASKSQINMGVASCIILSNRRSTSSDRPSPLEFDKFVPWVCLQFQILVEVAVIKAVVEKHASRRKTSTSSRLKTSELKHQSQSRVSSDLSKKPVTDETKSIIDIENKIPITAYYDTSGHLIELVICKSEFKIQRKLIKCINMCLPFHPTLLKFSVKSRLTSDVLYEIAKLLPHSNITDMCLDDCYIPEGNYFVLIDNLSALKVLSLRRCKINDVVCKEIAKRLDLGGTGETLTVLDLGTNKITDRGLWHLADILRRNRSLIHLSLCSNKITDFGFQFLMNHLKEFPMSQEEIHGRKSRRSEFYKKNYFHKVELENHPENIADDTVTVGTQVHFRSVKPHKIKSPKKKKSASIELTAAAVKKEEFIEVFDDNNTVLRNGYMHCVGNFVLCSLNLAYNELEFLSVKRILDVLLYQRKKRESLHRTGLMRIVLDGNYIPYDCDEMNEIRLLLSPVSTGSQSQRNLKGRSSFLKKH